MQPDNNNSASANSVDIETISGANLAQIEYNALSQSKSSLFNPGPNARVRVW